MKRTCELTVAVLAAAMVVGVVGAAPASATVLCKSRTPVCPSSDVYGTGTTISASVSPQSPVALVEPGEHETMTECTAGSWSTRVTNSGGASKPVEVADVSFALSGCTFGTITVTSLSSDRIEWREGVDGRLVTGNLTIKWVNPWFGTCYYQYGGTQFTVDGGSSAALSGGGKVNRFGASSFTCPEAMEVIGGYDVGAPVPLYVSKEAF